MRNFWKQFTDSGAKDFILMLALSIVGYRMIIDPEHTPLWFIIVIGVNFLLQAINSLLELILIGLKYITAKIEEQDEEI